MASILVVLILVLEYFTRIAARLDLLLLGRGCLLSLLLLLLLLEEHLGLHNLGRLAEAALHCLRHHHSGHGSGLLHHGHYIAVAHDLDRHRDELGHHRLHGLRHDHGIAALRAASLAHRVGCGLHTTKLTESAGHLRHHLHKLVTHLDQLRLRLHRLKQVGGARGRGIHDVGHLTAAHVDLVLLRKYTRHSGSLEALSLLMLLQTLLKGARLHWRVLQLSPLGGR